MKYSTLFLFGLFCTPSLVYGACSNANLTKCLDSVCAINFGANPAARCQYCGSASAGEPTKSTAMKSISAGASTKYIISDKELKNAPKDPGDRYVWATEQCLKKVSGCTPDDVSDTYDTLIEQSCKAAGIATEMANLSEKINSAKSKSTCSTEITSCIINEKRCLADYRNCEEDANFDKYFADCGILSSGCESYLKEIRTDLISARDTAIKNADTLLSNIVSSYQNTRKQKLESTMASCKDGSAKNRCIENVCKNNMRHHCDTGYESEQRLAEQLCKFYDIACDRLK